LNEDEEIFNHIDYFIEKYFPKGGEEVKNDDLE